MKKLIIAILLLVLCGTIGVQVNTFAQTDNSTENATEQTTPTDNQAEF